MLWVVLWIFFLLGTSAIIICLSVCQYLHFCLFVSVCVIVREFCWKKKRRNRKNYSVLGKVEACWDILTFYQKNKDNNVWCIFAISSPSGPQLLHAVPYLLNLTIVLFCQSIYSTSFSSYPLYINLNLAFFLSTYPKILV